MRTQAISAAIVFEELFCSGVKLGADQLPIDDRTVLVDGGRGHDSMGNECNKVTLRVKK